MRPAVYGRVLAVIEVFEVKAYRGRVRFRRPCQTPSFKAEGKRLDRRTIGAGGGELKGRSAHFSNYANKEMYVIISLRHIIVVGGVFFGTIKFH